MRHLGFNLRVSHQTLQKMNRTSIPLSDGSGYIAGLDTTHHLHCLISIRHALAPDYYADEIATMYKPAGEVYPTHIAHCLEILRMMILCKSDGSLFTYAWSMEQKAPLTNFAVEHTCTNWERLTGWARENSFNIHDDLLVHPKFGEFWISCVVLQWWVLMVRFFFQASGQIMTLCEMKETQSWAALLVSIDNLLNQIMTQCQHVDPSWLAISFKQFNHVQESSVNVCLRVEDSR